MSEFLNSNQIIDLNIKGLTQKLKLEDAFYQSVKSLSIDNDKFISFNKFNKLQILELQILIENIYLIIPYLASEFTADTFKRMQIILHLNDKATNIKTDLNLDDYRKTLPKNIQING